MNARAARRAGPDPNEIATAEQYKVDIQTTMTGFALRVRWTTDPWSEEDRGRFAEQGATVVWVAL